MPSLLGELTARLRGKFADASSAWDEASVGTCEDRNKAANWFHVELEVSGGVFQREYENATVRLDCHSFNATIRPKM